MQRIKCAEVWGGIKNEDVDVCSAGLTATLYSSAADGGKGGDIYYFSVCGCDELTRIALADVQGHGEEVSMLSEWLYAALNERMEDPDGGAVLSDLNHLAVRRGFTAVTTAAVVAFYTRNSDLFYSYAGHHPMLLRRSGQSVWKSVDLPANAAAANLPLGVDDSVHFDQAMTPLGKGDCLFLYTDGVIEAPDADGELFGVSRLTNLLDQADGDTLYDIKRHVLESVRGFTGGSLSHDDVTLMAVQVN